MPRQINVTVDEWLYKEIESRRGMMNRSEFVSQTIVKGLGLVDGESQ